MIVYLKWFSTIFVLTGILFANLNYYPLNIIIHGSGAFGWAIAGFLSADKALMTNFSLQLPLFFIGYYKLLF